MRYINNTILNTIDKKRYISSIEYPIIEKLESDTYIISKKTDRLDLLSHTYYNDSSLYWILAICNNIKGTIYIKPGIQLCIPSIHRLSNIKEKLKELNS